MQVNEGKPRFMGKSEVSLSPYGSYMQGFGSRAMGTANTIANDHVNMDTTGGQSGKDGNNGKPPAAPSYRNAVINEDCTAKIYEFCYEHLHISGPTDKIRIERAHRMGPFTPGNV